MSDARTPTLPPLYAAVATLATMMGGCASPSEPPPTRDRQTPSVAPPPLTPVCARESTLQTTDVGAGAHGMWVWGTSGRLDDPNAAAVLLETSAKVGLTELYLSVNDAVLGDPRLPELVGALGRAGLRVEALMGDATWSEPAHLKEMLAHVDAVGAYNAAHAPGFAAVHLDIEPHQLPTNKADHAFLPALSTALATATERAERFCMSTSADLPRFALEEAGPSFATAVPRLFVMLYELPQKTAPRLTLESATIMERTYEGLTREQRGRVVVSLRVEDYADELGTMVSALDDVHEGTSRYGGWAIHDEAKYRALTRR